MMKANIVRCVAVVLGMVPGLARGQALPWLDETTQQTSALVERSSVANPQAVIAAGTHVMMALRSPLNTTSGTKGSAVYLETLFPVIQGNRVIIPAHTLVQGTVESNKRPGHLKRVSEFCFHFTNMIFPNNYVLAIDGVLQGIPGSSRVRAEENGALKPVDQTEKVVIPAVAGTVAGAVIGSASHFGIGKFIGAGLGAGLGLGKVVLVRGDDINLRPGVNIEMVLRLPAALSPEQVDFNAHYIAPAQAPAPFVDPDDGGKECRVAAKQQNPRALTGASVSGRLLRRA